LPPVALRGSVLEATVDSSVGVSNPAPESARSSPAAPRVGRRSALDLRLFVARIAAPEGGSMGSSRRLKRRPGWRNAATDRASARCDFCGEQVAACVASHSTRTTIGCRRLIRNSTPASPARNARSARARASIAEFSLAPPAAFA
jgi:hypothetical protein